MGEYVEEYVSYGVMSSLDYAGKQATTVATQQVKHAAELGRISYETQIGVAGSALSEAVGAVAGESAGKAILQAADVAQEVSETVHTMGENVGVAMASQNAAVITQNLLRMSPQEMGMTVYNTTVKPYVDFGVSTGKFVRNSITGELEWQEARQWLLDTSTAVQTTAMIAGAVVSGGAALTALAVANLAAVSTSAVLNIIETPELNTFVYEGANVAVAGIGYGQARDAAVKQALQKQLVASGVAKEAAEAQVEAMFKNKALTKELAALAAKSVSEQFNPSAGNNAGFNVETLTGILTTAAASYQLSSAAEALSGQLPTQKLPQAVTKGINTGVETAIMSGSETHAISKNLMLGMGGAAHDAAGVVTPSGSTSGSMPGASSSDIISTIVPNEAPGAASASETFGVAPSDAVSTTVPGETLSAATLTDTVNRLMADPGMTSQPDQSGASTTSVMNAHPVASDPGTASSSEPSSVSTSSSTAESTQTLNDIVRMGMLLSRLEPPPPSHGYFLYASPEQRRLDDYRRRVNMVERAYQDKIKIWAEQTGQTVAEAQEKFKTRFAQKETLASSDSQFAAILQMGKTLTQKNSEHQENCPKGYDDSDKCIALIHQTQQIEQDITDALEIWRQHTGRTAAETQRIKFEILHGQTRLMSLSDKIAFEKMALEVGSQQRKQHIEEQMARIKPLQEEIEAAREQVEEQLRHTRPTNERDIAELKKRQDAYHDKSYQLHDLMYDLKRTQEDEQREQRERELTSNEIRRLQPQFDQAFDWWQQKQTARADLRSKQLENWSWRVKREEAQKREKAEAEQRWKDELARQQAEEERKRQEERAAAERARRLAKEEEFRRKQAELDAIRQAEAIAEQARVAARRAAQQKEAERLAEERRQAELERQVREAAQAKLWEESQKKLAAENAIRKAAFEIAQGIKAAQSAAQVAASNAASQQKLTKYYVQQAEMMYQEARAQQAAITSLLAQTQPAGRAMALTAAENQRLRATLRDLMAQYEQTKRKWDACRHQAQHSYRWWADTVTAIAQQAQQALEAKQEEARQFISATQATLDVKQAALSSVSLTLGGGATSVALGLNPLDDLSGWAALNGSELTAPTREIHIDWQVQDTR